MDWLTNPVDARLLRVIVNWVRREVSAEEKSKSLAEIAEMTGWTPKEISETLGIPYRTIMRYMPDEYKERPGAGGPKVAAREVSKRVATVATQEAPEARAKVATRRVAREVLNKFYVVELRRRH
ncbi:hypothetical protein J7L60_01980 [Candidatus Bathyarchaeota archaeon]|nr:hypothetical protein [Candidatus Bathyarchaeota archaeon]